MMKRKNPSLVILCLCLLISLFVFPSCRKARKQPSVYSSHNTTAASAQSFGTGGANDDDASSTDDSHPINVPGATTAPQNKPPAQTTKPSIATAVVPEKILTPDQLLELYCDCLQKGDRKTLESLFVPSANVNEMCIPGPLRIHDVFIRVDTERLASENSNANSPANAIYMKLQYRVNTADLGGSSVQNTPEEQTVSCSPILVKVNEQWKIQTLG